MRISSSLLGGRAASAWSDPRILTVLRIGVALGVGSGVVPSGVLAGQQVARITGRVTAFPAGTVIPGAVVALEGLSQRVRTDPQGRFFLDSLPPGPQVLHAIAIGYAPLRQTVLVPPAGTLTVNLVMAASALDLPGLIVTADPVGRARGELTTASVIQREAIRNQAAASLLGILELIPGVVLGPPGLGGVQQLSLRSVPVSPGGAGATVIAGQPTADALASFGTQIVLDGIPISNNTNFQTLGPRGELSFPTSSGGGVDLRRFPASTIERVEVIRGVPSARYGDLTQGAVLVETRAGRIAPEVIARADSRSLELSIAGGGGMGGGHLVSGFVNGARTLIAPGQTDDVGYRLAFQVAHRFETSNLVLDTRVDGFRLVEDRPERPIFPGLAYRASDMGLRISERARLRLGPGLRAEASFGVEAVRQRTYSQAYKLRGAQPVTDAVTEGRNVGRYLAGPYLAKTTLDGDPRNLFFRPEVVLEPGWLGARHTLRTGVELRREWNHGAGLQYDIAFPPQDQFNGVNGFARPRRLDAIPPLLLSALYVDDRATWRLGPQAYLAIQAGMRLDALHEGGSLTRLRDYRLGPRLTLEASPRPWTRIRIGAGSFTKTPSLVALYPPPQYHDLINVNYYANAPAERLAVITTRILDPTNPSLGLSVADHLEAGWDLSLSRDVSVTMAAFAEHTRDAVGFAAAPRFLIRERYALHGVDPGSGSPPCIVEPPIASDTVPVIVNRPAPVLSVRARGFELQGSTPELPGLASRIQLSAAWTRDAMDNAGILVNSEFSDFQVNEQVARAPYWNGTTRTGARLLTTLRLVHQQPRAGLVITGTIQATLRERRRDIGATDTLSFSGYVTRAGELVPIPPDRRSDPEFADLRVPLKGQQAEELHGASGWMLNLQVAKSLPLGGRFVFYAFNALDRIGSYGDAFTAGRLYPRMRFGMELTMPVPIWR